MIKNLSDTSHPKSVLLHGFENVPIHEVGHSSRKYIFEKTIQDLATKKYEESGYGITFEDVKTSFCVPKPKAQRSLKYFHDNGVLFTAKDLTSQGINFISNTNPQQYFPTSIKPNILENLKKTRIVPVEPTGVNLSTANLESLLRSPTSNAIKYQTEIAQSLLEVLLLLPFTPPFMHKLQLLLYIDQKYYHELEQKEDPVNKAKRCEEIIGRRHVIYTYSPNGAVEVSIRSNDTPFRLATDEDVSIIFAFLGQVKDRLLYHVRDPKERKVPSIMKWTLKACDLNKDILINDKAQLILPGIQLNYADRVFRSYVKIMEGKASYRLEESLSLNQILPEAFDNIRHPFKSVEDKLDHLSEKISQLNNSLIRISYSSDKLAVQSPFIVNDLNRDRRWV
jgi:hypothetical protein